MSTKSLIAAIVVIIVVIAAAAVVWSSNTSNNDTPADVPGEDTPEEIPDDSPGETPGEDTPGTDTPGTDVPGEDTPGDDTPDEPIGPDTDVELRTDVQVGDYIIMKYHEYAVMNGETIENSSIETETVVSIDGDMCTVSNESNGGVIESTYSESVFLNELVPYDYELPETLDRQETLMTTWGNIVCDVYVGTNLDVDIDGEVVMTFWIDESTGVAMKVLITIDDATTNTGEYVEHYENGFELVDTSLIS